MTHDAWARSLASLGQDGQQAHVGKITITDRAGLGRSAPASAPPKTVPELLGENQDFQKTHAQRWHGKLIGRGYAHLRDHGHRQHQGRELLQGRAVSSV